MRFHTATKAQLSIRSVRKPQRATLKTVHLFHVSAMLIACGACAAQERCSTELKLILSPGEIQSTVAKLKAQKESSGTVYFFDTDKRELLAQGVIVRIRRGSTADLTVKLRSPEGQNFENLTNGKENAKCEADVAAHETNISYSIRTTFTGVQIPMTGDDIYQAFSTGQRRMLKAAHVIVDWNQVKRVADIKVTDWQSKSGPRSEKLALELWAWPRGQILELSRRGEGDSSSEGYKEFRKMAVDLGLRLSTDQRSKTRMVLEANTISVTK